MSHRYSRFPTSGPDCRTCGRKAINVVHDDEAARARNIASWASPSPGQNNQDYYTWAGIVYHEFAPPGYLRGYQAGYHAKPRESKP